MKQLKKHRKKALNFVARFEWRLSKTCAQLSSDTFESTNQPAKYFRSVWTSIITLGK